MLLITNHMQLTCTALVIKVEDIKFSALIDTGAESLGASARSIDRLHKQHNGKKFERIDTLMNLVVKNTEI